MKLSSRSFLPAQRRIPAAGLKRHIDVCVSFDKHPQRKPHPECIEKEQIHPRIHERAGVKARASTQPFGGKCHES